MCLDYEWNPDNPDIADMFLGDTQGNVIHFKFKQATSRQFAAMPSNWLEHGTVHIRDVVGAEFVGPDDPLWEMGKVRDVGQYPPVDWVAGVVTLTPACDALPISWCPVALL